MKLHLSPVGNPPPPLPRSAGVLDYLDDLVRGVFGQALCESLIAVHGYVFVDIFGVDDAAVAQRDSLLLLIELSLVEALDGVAGHGVVIEQVLDYSALDEVLVNYLGDVLNLYLAVERTLGIDNDYRAQGAQTEAACPDDLDFVCETFLGDLLFKLGNYFCAVRRSTAGTAADKNVNDTLISSLLFGDSADRKFRNGVAVDEVVADNARDHFGRYLYIGDLFLARLENLDYRLILAHTDAAGLRDGDVAEIAARNLVNKGCQHGLCARRDAAGRHADEYAGRAFAVVADVHIGFALSLIALSSASDFMVVPFPAQTPSYGFCEKCGVLVDIFLHPLHDLRIVERHALENIFYLPRVEHEFFAVDLSAVDKVPVGVHRDEHGYSRGNVPQGCEVYAVRMKYGLS